MLPRHVREDAARALTDAGGLDSKNGANLAPSSLPNGFTATREFVKVLAFVGVLTGCLLGSFTALVARFPQWLTADAALYGIMASFIPWMMASLVMAGVCVCVCE